ncbi:citrate transporter [Ruoffia tabacinasalis]|uniref:Citrate transporter n=1 Tax=Ruoffia tabacinasalis TaxID=87458 RepID=A0A5R9EJ65_9LACT|nr:SLC13 family permease [Ruoffia tabacinasalis]TLQ48980.1 citrate transporter [Ruoffia tabacinasalis]
MYLAIIGFILIIILMYILIGEKMSPPMAFIILPLIAAVVSGASIADISLYVNDGLASILNTAVLFLFSISFFTLMSEQGLFDPLVDFVISKVGNKITAIFIAVLLVSTVAHLDGSGASTYLIAIPAFKPIMDKLGVKPVVFLGTVTGLMAAMNIIPWGGPTIRAASVAGIEVSDLYSFILPAVVVMFLLAIINAVINSRRKREGSVDGNVNIVDLAGDVTSEPKTSKGLYIYNLVVTLNMLALLFIDTGLPMHFIFMVAYAFAILGNFRSVKEQGKKIQEYGNNAIVMTMTLFAVGIFIGVIEGSGMVEAMATTIINALPEFIAPHTHWFLALFSVPLMMVLGTDAFYFALLPIVIGIVEPFGISASTVAATFLITGTYGTYISPTVAANYVGVSLAGTTIGEHIKANLPIMWAASIITLIAATLLGVVQF